MRVIAAKCQAKFINQNRSAEFQLQRSFRITVDAPALIRIFSVCGILKDPIDGIAGSKDCLTSGFHVGTCMRIESGVSVLIVGVEGKISPGIYFFRECHSGTDDMAIALEAFRAVDNGLFAERNGEIDFSFFHIDECRRHGIFELNHAVTAGREDFQCNAVTFFIFVCVDKTDDFIGIAGHECMTRLVQYFEFDGFS